MRPQFWPAGFVPRNFGSWFARFFAWICSRILAGELFIRTGEHCRTELFILRMLGDDRRGQNVYMYKGKRQSQHLPRDLFRREGIHTENSQICLLYFNT